MFPVSITSPETRTRPKIKGVGEAAELLGVKPTTLSSRIEKMGLKRPAEELRIFHTEIAKITKIFQKAATDNS
jgi:hypothetical protein